MGIMSGKRQTESSQIVRMLDAWWLHNPDAGGGIPPSVLGYRIKSFQAILCTKGQDSHV